MFTSSHKLDFYCSSWRDLGGEVERILNEQNASKDIRHFIASITRLAIKNEKVQLFGIGTCKGVWYPTDNEYRILYVFNMQKGNGHFDDVIEWFESSCKRDKRNLVFEEVINKRLSKHLIKERGFIKRRNDCIKYFNLQP